MKGEDIAFILSVMFCLVLIAYNGYQACEQACWLNVAQQIRDANGDKGWQRPEYSGDDT